MITKENYITAHFIDSERKNIEILLKDDKKTYSHIVEYDTKYPVCQELLKVCTLDDLHKNTYEKKKGEKKGFEDMVMRLAKRDGLVFDATENKFDTKFYPVLVKAIFDEVVNEDHLFALKLALFEIKQIRDSKDSESKQKLRQTKNKIEALKIAIEIVNA